MWGKDLGTSWPLLLLLGNREGKEDPGTAEAELSWPLGPSATGGGTYLGAWFWLVLQGDRRLRIGELVLPGAPC